MIDVSAPLAAYLRAHGVAITQEGTAEVHPDGRVTLAGSWLVQGDHPDNPVLDMRRWGPLARHLAAGLQTGLPFGIPSPAELERDEIVELDVFPAKHAPDGHLQVLRGAREFSAQDPRSWRDARDEENTLGMGVMKAAESKRDRKRARRLKGVSRG